MRWKRRGELLGVVVVVGEEKQLQQQLQKQQQLQQQQQLRGARISWRDGHVDTEKALLLLLRYSAVQPLSHGYGF
ncbi:unnamed protein product [Lampetra planeri]